MLSTKHASMAIKILALLIAAALSFFVATAQIPEAGFMENSFENLEESSNTVMKFSAATLSASLAITALPDDFATPLADSLADMNVYFVAILVVLFLEKVLLQSGVKLAFAIIIPLACFMGILAVGIKKNILRSLAVRLCVLGLAVAFVVPCSTHLTNVVAADLNAYVNETIGETEDGANKLQEAIEGGTEEKSVFEKMSDLFQTAIHDVSDLMTYFQNNIRKCMNSIAILILTNCLMPLLTFFILKWILKETFQIVVPMVPLRMPRYEAPVPEAETAAAGE